jgi:hypothetical protein
MAINTVAVMPEQGAEISNLQKVSGRPSDYQ